MKKSLFIAALCIFVFIESQAQISFSPGLRGGANFSKITQLESDFKSDFYVGVYGALRLGKLYTLQPELTYSNQGATNIEVYPNLYETTETQSKNETVTISYLSMGLSNKIHFNNQFSFLIGPTLDFQVSKSIYTNTDVDFGFVTGINYKLFGNLELDGRFKVGVLDVFRSDYSASNSPHIHRYNTNLLFQVGLSYTFKTQIQKPN